MKRSACLALAVVAVALFVLVGCRAAGSGTATTVGDTTTTGGGQDAGGGGGATTDDGTGAGDDGADDGDTGAGVEPPEVALSTTGGTGDLLYLTCTVLDDGGGTVTSFNFTSTAGDETLTQDGGSTATAYVPAIPTIVYECTGTNEAGTGPSSNQVIVNGI